MPRGVAWGSWALLGVALSLSLSQYMLSPPTALLLMFVTSISGESMINPDRSGY